jgi:hypothetical protein
VTNRQAESQKRFEYAKTLVDQGMNISNAAKQAKISVGTWYLKSKQEQSKPKKIPLTRSMVKKKHAFIDLSAVQQAPRIAIVITTPAELKDVLKGLL